MRNITKGIIFIVIWILIYLLELGVRVIVNKIGILEMMDKHLYLSLTSSLLLAFFTYELIYGLVVILKDGNKIDSQKELVNWNRKKTLIVILIILMSQIVSAIF